MATRDWLRIPKWITYAATPTPPARRPAQSNSGWVDDAHIAQTIVEGGVAVKLSAGMAPNPDLKDKPEVVAELVKIVRKFGE